MVLLLMVVNKMVWGYLARYQEQASFSTCLTAAHGFGYLTQATAKSVAGFCRPKRRRTHRHQYIGGFFVSVAWLVSLWAGRAGAFGLAGAPSPVCKPHGPVHFAFCSAMGGELFPLQDGEKP